MGFFKDFLSLTKGGLKKKRGGGGRKDIFNFFLSCYTNFPVMNQLDIAVLLSI